MRWWDSSAKAGRNRGPLAAAWLPGLSSLSSPAAPVSASVLFSLFDLRSDLAARLTLFKTLGA